MTHQQILLIGAVLAAFGVGTMLRRARRVAQDTSRRVSMLGRVLLGAAVIVGVQWAVLSRSDSAGLKIAVLVLPALVAAGAVVRSLTITMVDGRRGGERR